jgi:hypothetical protein
MWKRKFDVPEIVWNDPISRLQMAVTVSGTTCVRVESIRTLRPEVIREYLPLHNHAWASLSEIRTALDAMVADFAVPEALCDATFEIIKASRLRFEDILPPKNALATEKKLIEFFASKGVPDLLTKTAVMRLTERGEVFYRMFSKPIEKVYDVRKLNDSASDLSLSFRTPSAVIDDVEK